MAVLVLSMDHLTWGVAGVSLLSLIVLGYISASVGGASKRRAIIRILFWGIAAMLITGVIGRLFGTVL